MKVKKKSNAPDITYFYTYIHVVFKFNKKINQTSSSILKEEKVSAIPCSCTHFNYPQVCLLIEIFFISTLRSK